MITNLEGTDGWVCPNQILASLQTCLTADTWTLSFLWSGTVGMRGRLCKMDKTRSPLQLSKQSMSISERRGHSIPATIAQITTRTETVLGYNPPKLEKGEVPWVTLNGGSGYLAALVILPPP